MNDQAIRFRLGIFVLGAFILLGVLIVLFGGLPGYFRDTEPYMVIFDSAPGVSPGTPVRRSGVRIGEVGKVALDDETGKVRVGINVDSKYSLRRQDQPVLMQGLLAGDTSIDFVARRPDGKAIPDGPVEPGSTLEGIVQADAGTLVQKTTDVVGPARDTMEEFRKFMKTMDKMTPLMEGTFKEYQELGKAARKVVPEFQRTNEELQVASRNWSKAGEKLDRLITDNEKKFVDALDTMDRTLKNANNIFSDENQKNINATLKNTKNSSDRFEGITKDTEAFMKDMRKTTQRFNETLDRADDVLKNMQKATKPFNERGDAIARNMDEAADKLNKLLTETREVMQAAARSDGTLQKLLTDPSLYDNLNATACMASRIMPRLDRILRDVEIFADKIARHPEALGIGGAVRPSSGLKEAPTVLPWRGH